MILRLITRENDIYKTIFKDNQLVLKLDNFLASNLSDDYDFYDEVFLNKIDFSYEPLTLMRIYNRFNNNLPFLNLEQISILADSKMLTDLDISLNKLEEITIFSWNLMNIVEATTLRLELSSLKEQLNSSNFTKKDYQNLIYYKNMLIYSNPILEKYIFTNEEITLTVSEIFTKYEEYSSDYRKVFQTCVNDRIIKEIIYLTNMILSNIDYSEYKCSEEVIKFLSLITIKSNLSLLNEQEFLILKNNIEDSINDNLESLISINKEKEISDIIKLLEEYSNNKKLIK